MNKIKVRIWGRDFELSVIYQNYPDEEITELQELTFQSLTSIDYLPSLGKVKEYIMKYNGHQITEDSIDNIFKFVVPKSIVIPREAEDKVFAIFCYYKFDMEHGLAVVFKNGIFDSVGAEDIIL